MSAPRWQLSFPPLLFLLPHFHSQPISTCRFITLSRPYCQLPAHLTTRSRSDLMCVSPPTWEYNPTAPALVVLGSVYEYLLQLD